MAVSVASTMLGLLIVAPVAVLVCKQRFFDQFSVNISFFQVFDPFFGMKAGIGRFLGAYNKHLYHTDLGATIEVTVDESAIEVTARNGHAAVMGELVSRVQSPDVFLDAFEFEVQRASLKAVEHLLAQGGDLCASLPGADHWLEISIRAGVSECAKLFHARGGDLNQFCERGGTLREWIREHGTKAIARWLPYDVLESRYLERYKREGKPMYISETCIVWFAVDSDQTLVALKCMQDRQYFESEVTTRRELSKSCAGAAIPMRRVHVPESEHSSFRSL